MSDDKRIPVLCDAILAGSSVENSILTLEEFKALYHCVAAAKDSVPLVHIVLLNKSAVLQFTDVASAKIVIRHNRRLTQEDFSDTVSRAVFQGDKREHSFWMQLKEEKKNAPILVMVWLIFALATFWIGVDPALHYQQYAAMPSAFPSTSLAIDGLMKISELIITSATLFITIFLVFTVAQNAGMLRDDYLFSEGLAHKYYRDDRFVSIVALVSLFGAIINVVMIAVPGLFEIPRITMWGFDFHINKFSVLIPLNLALSASGLALCFLSILYYFERVVINAGVTMADRSLSGARKRYLARIAVESRNFVSKRRPNKRRGSQPEK